MWLLRQRDKKSYRLQPPCMDANILQNSYLSVKVKAQTIVITEQNVL